LGFASGCGGDDDDDDAPGGGGSGGSVGGSGGSDGGSGGGKAGTGGGGGSGGSSGGGSSTDACTNASDMTAIGASYGAAGAGGAVGYTDIVADCGLGCIGDLGTDDIPAVIECTEACVSVATDDAVSADCTNCFTQSALCAFENCIARCAADPAAAACLACRCNAADSGNMNGVNCEAGFATCSGINRMLCD
jgi:hypothetical protein